MPAPPSDVGADAGGGKRLDSWKAIAAYLNCGVRTVQRWEKTEGLPVRRHVHQAQATVYAFVSDIDRWREERADLVARGDALPPGAVEATRPAFVGRSHELERLHTLWRRALSGVRQVVFVTGEIGIGKTRLVRTFIDQLATRAWIIEGHCVEHYGVGEAYLPVIEGLAKFRRQPEARSAAALLARHAPSWLPRLPDNSVAGTATAGGASPPRIAHELIDAIERMARDRPVVLFVDDLHWSDWSTAELIDRIARRTEPAAILVLGTYRADDLMFREHPLLRIQHELRVHQRCDEIQVPRFVDSEIAEYLLELGIDRHLQRATSQLRKWTGGNPLFLEVVLEHLAAQGCVTSADGVCDLEDPMATPPSMPSTLHDIVDDRIQRLSVAERELLEAASVAGPTFSAAAIAAAVRMDVEHVERVFDSLARRHEFVTRTGIEEPPGAPPTVNYAFLHSLYATGLYDRLSPHSRIVLHRAIATHLEQSADSREETAAALAMHFERARDFERAVTYYEAAATTALSRSADHEAHRCAVKALEHLSAIAPGLERDRRELHIRLKLCAALSGMSTMSDPQVQRAYSDALTVSERIRDDAELVPALLGISRFEITRGNLVTGRESANRAVAISRTTRDPVLLIPALQHAAATYFATGELDAADDLLNEALNAYTEGSSTAGFLTVAGFGPVAAALYLRSATLWHLGHPDAAIRFARRAVAQAERLGHPQTVAFTKGWGAATLASCGVAEGRAWAESALGMGRQFDFPMAAFFAEGVLGWIRVRSADPTGIESIRSALDFQARAGIRPWIPLMQTWHAEGLLLHGEPDAALAAAAAGLAVAAATGARSHDAELHGVWADAAAALGRHAERDEHLREAAAIARAQRALSFELRTAVRRVRAAPTSPSACADLSRIYERFTEGFDTSDLLEARSLLDACRYAVEDAVDSSSQRGR
jgi:tetratricopeptide (TPR) repeat protein/type II secretory pathway predicted ATPase ExeA